MKGREDQEGKEDKSNLRKKGITGNLWRARCEHSQSKIKGGITGATCMQFMKDSGDTGKHRGRSGEGKR